MRTPAWVGTAAALSRPLPSAAASIRYNAGMSQTPVALSEKQLKFLRGKAHPLNPVIMIGQAGLSDGVVAETDRALTDHELIKVKVRGADRDARDAMLAQLGARTGSTLVTRIGHVAVLYRRHPQLPKLVIPD
jgi:RNA-binding protein